MSTKSIAAAEAQRATKAAELKALAAKAEGEGRTLTADEQTQFDDGMDDIKKLDAHLSRLKAFNELDTPATPVVVKAGEGATKIASDARGGNITHSRKNDEVPGLALARLVQCKAMSAMAMRRGEMVGADQFAKQLFGFDNRIEMALKGPVAPGTTVETTWAAPLVNEWGAIYADFVEFLRPRTLVGRFGTNGVPALRRVPFRRPLISQTTGGEGYWVGEGMSKPLTKFDFTATNLDPTKVASIAVITMELARDSSPSASMVVRDQLVEANQARIDIDFIDPTKTADPGISPASITNGAPTVSASGVTADHLRADFKDVMALFAEAKNPPASGVWIMPTVQALGISLLTNALGQPEFPGITMNGGTLFGLPVLVSDYVPHATSGGYIVLVNASDIYFADEGGFAVDMSGEASLQMDSTPDEPTSASTVLVSLWQRNLLGFRAERTLNWAKRRASAVAMISGANYGG